MAAKCSAPGLSSGRGIRNGQETIEWPTREFDGAAALKSFQASPDKTCFEFSLLHSDGGHGYSVSRFIRLQCKLSSEGGELSRFRR
jgi:hypothetical protein